MTLVLHEVQPPPEELAVMLSGGGARAAYQVGLIRGLARHFPNLRFQIITGVSAGAINALFLAASKGNLAEEADRLADVWCELTCRSIWQFDWKALIPFRRKWRRRHGLMGTEPLSKLLCQLFDSRPGKPVQGVIDNLRQGWLHAVALTTLDYSTGQSVCWMQGRAFDDWEGPNRRNEQAELTPDHVLASCALPLLFPAVRIGNAWHGDGGIRLAAPLAPAVHLGATRILAMSTGYQRTPAEARAPVVWGYPPAAQIIGQLLNAIFLDAIDEDVMRMGRMNEMIEKIDSRERNGFKPIDLLVLRPSVDLGKLASQYEHHLPRNLKVIMRALGAKETESPDLVSLIMFEPHYTQRLIEIGEGDVESRLAEIRAFLGPSVAHAVA